METEALKLSSRAFSLQKPPGDRAPGAITQSAFGAVEHPRASRFEWALYIPDDFKIRRHAAYLFPFNYDALKLDIAEAFSIDDADELERIGQTIINHDDLTVSQLIPASWQPRFLTQEQAQADGWLDDPE